MSEVEKNELLKMFDVATEDLTKANKLLASEPSRKEAANRFIKLSRRFYDLYKLFTDTFNENLNVIAAKAILHFSRVCLIVSQTLMSTNWFQIPENTNTKKRLLTLPGRAAHKIYKRKINPAFYFYNHDDEDYKKLGFVKIDKSTKREYEKELQAVAAGLKQIGCSLLLLFNSTELLPEEVRNQEFEGRLPKLEKLDFNFGLNDLKMARRVVYGYYEAIIEQNKLAENDEEETKTIIEVLSPLMEDVNMRLRKNVVSKVYDKSKTKGMFSEMTDSVTELVEVSKLIVMLDEFEG